MPLPVTASPRQHTIQSPYVPRCCTVVFRFDDVGACGSVWSHSASAALVHSGGSLSAGAVDSSISGEQEAAFCRPTTRQPALAPAGLDLSVPASHGALRLPLTLTTASAPAVTTGSDRHHSSSMVGLLMQQEEREHPLLRSRSDLSGGLHSRSDLSGALHSSGPSCVSDERFMPGPEDWTGVHGVRYEQGANPLPMSLPVHTEAVSPSQRFQTQARGADPYNGVDVRDAFADDEEMSVWVTGAQRLAFQCLS